MNDEDRLSDLLLHWEELLEQGRDVSAAELCRDCPELEATLAKRIIALKSVRWVATPSGAGDPEAAAWPTPGTLAGRYRIDGLLGVGGFGQVWRGFDMELERPVAVKIPHPRGPSDRPGPAKLANLLAEGRRLARLKHPRIVEVHDVVPHQGGYGIILDLIDGTDLGRHLGGQPASVREAVRIVVAVAEALDHAHRHGIIHRDVKPANILIDAAGQVYLTDFGIALTGQEQGGPPMQVCGTLPYMSPEQVTHPDRLDLRADIYSLGVILHELLTGVRPGGATVNLHTRPAAPEPVPPPSAGREVPAGLERIWRKCLSLDPEQRYASARQLAEELRHALAGVLSEADWVASDDPAQMLSHLYLFHADPRKVRLFACACVRHDWSRLVDDRSRRAVEVAERFADGEAGEEELTAARGAAWDASIGPASQAAAWAAEPNVWSAAREAPRATARHTQASLLHDLFGPPLFRRVTVPRAWLDHDAGAVAHLAGRIYREQAFDRLPDLGAALRRAGCLDRDLLAHCLGKGLHAKGCWAVDVVMGRE